MPTIRECAARAYAPSIAPIGRAPAPMVADFAALVAAGEVHVATDAVGDLLGFIVFRAAPTHVFLENVAVFPHAQVRGVGKALVHFCEGAARARGLGAVHLYTNAKMTANLIFYPRLGYREVARRRDDGFDRVFFEKPLL